MANKNPTMTPYQKSQQDKAAILNLGIDLLYGDPSSQDYKTKLPLFRAVVDKATGQKAASSGGLYSMIGSVASAITGSDEYPSLGDTPSTQKAKILSLLDGLQTVFNTPQDTTNTFQQIPVEGTQPADTSQPTF
jgi:hypothetical protein